MWAKVREFLVSCPLYMPIALLELCRPQLTPGKPWPLAGKPVPLQLTGMPMPLQLSGMPMPLQLAVMLMPLTLFGMPMPLLQAGLPLPLHEDSWHANAVGASGPTSASVAR